MVTVTTPHSQVGAIAFDPLQFPCTGVQTMIDAVDLSAYSSGKNGLAAWVGLMLSNGVWIQVGYGSAHGGPNIGFVQVWNLNNQTVLYNEGFSITLGRHAFGIVYDKYTQYWDITYDDEIVASYLMGTNLSAGGPLWYQGGLSLNAVPTAYCAIENINGDTFPVDINFPLGLLLRDIYGTWAQVPLAFEIGGVVGGSITDVFPNYGASRGGANSVTIGPSQPFIYFIPVWLGANPSPPPYPTGFFYHDLSVPASLTLSNQNDGALRTWAIFLDNGPGAYLGNGMWQNGQYQIASNNFYSGSTFNFNVVAKSGRHTVFVVVSSPPNLGVYTGQLTLTLPSGPLTVNFSSSPGINSGSYDGVTAIYDIAGLTNEVLSPPGPIFLPAKPTLSSYLVAGLALLTGAAVLWVFL